MLKPSIKQGAQFPHWLFSPTPPFAWYFPATTIPFLLKHVIWYVFCAGIQLMVAVDSIGGNVPTNERS